MPNSDDSFCYYNFINEFNLYSVEINYNETGLSEPMLLYIMFNEVWFAIEAFSHYVSIEQFKFSSTVGILQWGYSSSSLT
jgi:hypothetical protein